MRRIGLLSGGEASWAACKTSALRDGLEGLTLLFTDTLQEDEDTYRFLRESAENIGAPLVVAADGRRVWEVFADEGMIGNTRADICSRALKRDVSERWLKENCDPAETEILIGYHVSEQDRFERARKRWAEKGWRMRAPLCETPLIGASEIRQWAQREGLRTQRLYTLGMKHANCGGACIKMGLAGWRHLLLTLPDVYAAWEAEEEAFRACTGKDVAILRDRAGGVTKPLTLKAFRERVQAGLPCDLFDWGGCGCFSGEDS